MTELFALGESVQEYNQEGVLFPIPVLSAQEITYFQKKVAELESFWNTPLDHLPFTNLFFPWSHQLTIHPRVTEAAALILGPELIVAATLILSKPARDSRTIPWHQDGTRSGWYRWPSVTAWLAIDKSDTGNGCMRFVPGSHQKGRLQHRPADHGSLLKDGDQLVQALDQNQVRDVILNPGEMSLHHGSVVHGSGANFSNERRLGFVIRFVTPAFRETGLPTPMVRAGGNQACPHLNLKKNAPTERPVDECIAKLRHFLKSRERTAYEEALVSGT